MTNYKVVKVWGTVISVVVVFYILTTVFKAVAGFAIAALITFSIASMLYVTLRDEENTSISPIVRLAALPAQIALASSIGLGLLVKEKAKTVFAPKP